MNWDAIGAIGEIVGAIAVVGTLAYLALQIRHNSNQSTANMAAGVLNEFNRMQEMLISQPYTTGILHKLKTGEELTPLEDTQLEAMGNRYITHWFQIEIAHERGLVDDAVYSAMCDDVKRMLSQYPRIRGKLLEILDFYSVSKNISILAPIFEQPPNKAIEADA